jgi:hypothetical protein
MFQFQQNRDVTVQRQVDQGSSSFHLKYVNQFMLEVQT